ncbi:MAG: DUF2332 domain-containing protein [Sphingomonadaceae bacterium]|nr:DUF2332 domain-containing protein [Sphingomonadaceae bacterium]
MPDEQDIQKLRAGLRHTVPRMHEYGARLYEMLMRAMLEDEDFLSFAVERNPATPLRLFFTVHYLQLRNPEWPLANYFQSITPEPSPPEEAYPHFKEYCLAHAGDVRALMAERTIQTTNTERAASLLLGLARAAEPAEPLSIIEIGCSAGILLLFDEFRYDYGDGGSVGREDARLTVPFSVVGANFRAPRRMPRIARRIGVDLEPVDPREPENHRWIMANLFPEWQAQRQRLERALTLRADYPLETYKGDAVALLPALLEQVRGPICVVHANVISFLPDEAQARLEAILRAESDRRPVHKVSLDVTRQQLEAGVNRSTLAHTRYDKGDARVSVLGNTDLLGQRLVWTAED